MYDRIDDVIFFGPSLVFFLRKKKADVTTFWCENKKKILGKEETKMGKGVNIFFFFYFCLTFLTKDITGNTESGKMKQHETRKNWAVRNGKDCKFQWKDHSFFAKMMFLCRGTPPPAELVGEFNNPECGNIKYDGEKVEWSGKSHSVKKMNEIVGIYRYKAAINDDDSEERHVSLLIQEVSPSNESISHLLDVVLCEPSEEFDQKQILKDFLTKCKKSNRYPLYCYMEHFDYYAWVVYSQSCNCYVLFWSQGLETKYFPVVDEDPKTEKQVIATKEEMELCAGLDSDTCFD